MAEERAHAPLLTIVTLATRQFRTLLRLDAQTLRAEIKEKASDIASSGVWLLIAFAMGLLGLFSLVQGLIALFVYMGLSFVAAPFVVGAILIAVATAFFIRGQSILNNWTALPVKTFSQVRKDIDAIEEAFHHASR
jgi:Putative Actinobacterial Holin-X, holin superfamily III